MQSGGELLSELLAKRYLNDSKAARQSGVHVNTIKALKAGKNQPNPDTIRKLAALFDREEAERLAEAFGYPGLLTPAPGSIEDLAGIIAKTEAALDELKEAYASIMHGRA
jgi:transcriptional regulator with XRE-family HTH domain